MVTSAGIAPLGIQSGSRAGGRLQRFPTSRLVGENLEVLNSCLCRNKGGNGGDGVCPPTAHGDRQCWGEGMSCHDIFVYQGTVLRYHLCRVV